MRHPLPAIAVIVIMTGCNSGQTACEGYVEAYNGCIEDFGSGNTIDSEITGCELVDDDNADYYDCLADAYSNGDCTTNEGWADTVEDAATCAYPTDTE